MLTSYLIKGIIIGFSVAAPVGPIGVLCIKRTLAEGRLSGLVTGMGAAVADTFYGIIAGFGLTAISSLLLAEQLWIRLIGGTFLLYIGIKILISKPAGEAAKGESKGLFSNFISTLFLTITNPTTILSFIAIFSAIGAGIGQSGYKDSAAVVLGVFIGSTAWWIILSSIIGMIRHKINTKALQWINRASGSVIIVFGLWTFYSLLK